MRWTSWVPLAASVVTAAAGAALTWENNPLAGDRSGLNVLFGDDASAPPVLILLGGLLMAVAGIAHPRVAILGALTTLGSAGWYGIHIAGTRVHAIGTDSAGNLIEPEATSHPGIGWYVTATALLAMAVLVISLGRHARTNSRPGPSGRAPSSTARGRARGSATPFPRVFPASSTVGGRWRSGRS